MALYRFIVEYGRDNAPDRYLNVYYYRTDVPTTSLDIAAREFGEQIWTAQRPITSVAYFMRSVTARQMDSTLNDGVYVPLSTSANYKGALAGDPMPPFCAYAIRLRTASRITRDGQKRYVGVSENVQVDGVLSPGVLNGLITLGSIAAFFEVGTVGFRGIIVRLSLDGQILLQNEISGVEPSTLVSTQTTRKAGRGQ